MELVEGLVRGNLGRIPSLLMQNKGSPKGVAVINVDDKQECCFDLNVILILNPSTNCLSDNCVSEESNARSEKSILLATFSIARRHTKKMRMTYKIRIVTEDYAH